jgi:hypothetical protein
MTDEQKELYDRCVVGYDYLAKYNDGLGIIVFLVDQDLKDFASLSNITDPEKIKILARHIQVLMEGMAPSKVNNDQSPPAVGSGI